MDFIDADPALSGDDHSEEENDEVATLSDEELIDDESQEENGASDHAQLDQLMEQAEEEAERKSVIDYIEEKCASPIPKRPRWMCGSLGLSLCVCVV